MTIENAEIDLSAAVLAAANRMEVSQAVADVYTSLADAIEIRRPICKTSGRCCRFEEFGHRMYVTTMELAKFVADWRLNELGREADGPVRPHALPMLGDRAAMSVDKPGCPFQIDGLCGVHRIRPFGCRIFFCDETSTAWQHDMYEQLHGRLRRLHDELQIPYFYVEWRFALRAVMPLTTARNSW